jgi:dephospho-CoA kinase
MHALMVVVGLTGKACSGKNVIAGMLADKGWRIVDVDKLGHPILQQAADEVRRDFGPETIGPDGVVNRKALGALVFADPSKLKTLEAITHPRMVAECKRIIAEETASGGQVVVLNAALLSRMHLDGLCDLVVFVRVPWYIRYRRPRCVTEWILLGSVTVMRRKKTSPSTPSRQGARWWFWTMRGVWSRFIDK